MIPFCLVYPSEILSFLQSLSFVGLLSCQRVICKNLQPVTGYFGNTKPMDPWIEKSQFIIFGYGFKSINYAWLTSPFCKHELPSPCHMILLARHVATFWLLMCQNAVKSQLYVTKSKSSINISSIFQMVQLRCLSGFFRMEQRCHRKADGPFGLIAFLEFGTLKRGGLREVGWSYPTSKRS